MNYYNDNEKTSVAWLKELIKEGLIPDGEVDDRSIKDIEPKDLNGFIQCHFFAGIGGWSYALRLAGWPDDRPVWTGSCPCQPFSVAGKGKGTNDERHLWPAFRWLIAQRRPATIFGEQVASKDGRRWLSGVRTDLEAMGYAVGASDLCAAGINAPHVRQRLWWVADAELQRHRQGMQPGPSGYDSRPDRWMGNATSDRRSEMHPDIVWGTERDCQEKRKQRLGGDCDIGRMVYNHKPWEKFELVNCLDGKKRRIESGLAPLVDGFPGRVGLVRGYGNAIVPQVAAEFIGAFMDSLCVTG